MDRGTVPTRLSISLSLLLSLHARLALSLPCLPRGFFFLKTSASLNINATLSLHIPPSLFPAHPHSLRIRTTRQNPSRFQTSLPLPSAESRYLLFTSRVKTKAEKLIGGEYRINIGCDTILKFDFDFDFEFFLFLFEVVTSFKRVRTN